MAMKEIYECYCRREYVYVYCYDPGEEPEWGCRTFRFQDGHEITIEAVNRDETAFIARLGRPKYTYISEDMDISDNFRRRWCLVDERTETRYVLYIKFVEKEEKEGESDGRHDQDLRRLGRDPERWGAKGLRRRKGVLRTGPYSRVYEPEESGKI